MSRAAQPPAPFARTLLALIAGQICLHACLAGVRMAAPLQALREHRPAWAIGVLMGLFAAAPIASALPAGRLADRAGYHRPMRIAIGLSVIGGILAVLSTWWGVGPGGSSGDAVGDASGFILLGLAAMGIGAGANVGMIVIQRSAGRSAASPTELKRVFSWLGLAPALSNVIGPVMAGALIDHGGFRLAFAGLLLLPMSALLVARWVPVDKPRPGSPADEGTAGGTAAPPRRRLRSWQLFAMPGFGRLLLVNWLLSSCWDVHAFVIPILGHERGFNASTIGLVLGVFAAAVSLVRLAIPFLAHRLRESQVLVGAMVASAAVLAVYPLVRVAWAMAGCALVLGLALGAVSPMIMATLHAITPDDRHGEAIAVRSMTINFSSAMMPLAFGFAGAALGAGSLFWLMGAAVGAGSLAARRIGRRDVRTDAVS